MHKPTDSPFLGGKGEAMDAVLGRRKERSNSISSLYGNAFGASVFASPSWPSRTLDNISDTIADIETDVNGIISTMDYLGLNDNYNRQLTLDADLQAKPFFAQPLFAETNTTGNLGLSTASSFNSPYLHPRPLDTPMHHPSSIAAAATENGEIPSKALWIGNITQATSAQDLDKIFSIFGTVDSVKMLPHKTCAFVYFSKLSDAVEAKKAMNGRIINGIQIKTGYAKKEGVVMSTPLLSDRDAMGERSNSVSSTASFAHTPQFASQHLHLMSPKLSATALHHPASPKMHHQQQQQAFGSPRMGNAAQISVAASPFLGTPMLNPSSAAPPGLAMTPSQGTGDLPIAAHTTPEEAMRMLALAGVPTPQQSPLRQALTATSLDSKYSRVVPALPEPKRVDQNRLRDLRKKLEGPGMCSASDVEAIYEEVLPIAVDLATDYIGNVVLQRIVEKGGDNIKLGITQKLAPHMAAIGIHKNGTWVVQKVIDTATSAAQIQCIVEALTPYTPPLMLDQFGNYVVQCCLRLVGSQRNQFIFDAISEKCWDIAQGRFGARAMRACLESQHTSKRQQKQVAIAIVHNVVALATNPNGAILVNWLLDTSTLPGRFRVVSPKIAPHTIQMACHKSASGFILKLVNQRTELDAREIITRELFFSDDNLQAILRNLPTGVQVIQKILATGCVSEEEKIKFADRVRSVLGMVPEVFENTAGYKRLLDELSVIPSGLKATETEGKATEEKGEVVSPLTPHDAFFAFPGAAAAANTTPSTPAAGMFATPSPAARVPVAPDTPPSAAVSPVDMQQHLMNLQIYMQQQQQQQKQPLQSSQTSPKQNV